jgi:hypothetical protein
MEKKTVQLLLPKDIIPEGTYTPGDWYAYFTYITEKNKKVEAAEKKKEKVNFFNFDDILEMYRYQEYDMPKGGETEYITGKYADSFFQKKKICLFWGITKTGHSVQLSYPLHISIRGTKYIKSFESYIEQHPELLELEKRVEDLKEKSHIDEEK